jgi:hypothetical protein
MDLYSALLSAKKDLVDESSGAVQKLGLEHYGQAGPETTRQRLADMYDLVVTAIHDRDLSEVVSFADGVAEERFSAGFDVSEVQLAVNVLETVMWRYVVALVPPEELATAIGLISTVFGCIKDELARRYVSLAAQRHVTSLDLSALFRGVAAY